MKIIKYNKSYQKIWDEFVKNSKNGTIFHTQTFLSYHKNRFKDASILIYKKNSLVALFPAVEIDNKIISHQGSTYGGLIVQKDNTLKRSFDIWNTIINYYNKIIEFRKNEYIFDLYPSEEIIFSAKKLGFKELYEELSTCLDLNFIKYTKGRKWCLNKCKNLKIIFDDINYIDFHKILVDNLKKHYSTPTHSLEEMLLIKKLLPNNYFLVNIYKDNKLIGGIWLVLANNQTAHTFYIAQDYNYNNYQPITCIVDYIIKYLKEKNLKYLNFGISTEEKGKYINYGLFQFKESFGGFGVSRKYFRREI